MTDAASARPIRVLIVEDAPTPGSEFVRCLQRDGDIAVIGQTLTGGASIELVERESPDVIILGISASDASGQRVIEQVMARAPTPILVLSSRIVDRQSPEAIEAIVAGALEALPTPERWTVELETGLRRTVRQISKVLVIRHPRGARSRTLIAAAQKRDGSQQAVVALAASTGGPTALATVLAGLSGLDAPVLMVQHLHPEFTVGLFGWMARASALPVELATHDQVAEPGHVYLAPGGFHLRLAAHGRLELGTSPVTVHQPSADELFRSVAAHAGAGGVGVILTGMGDDGARGLLEIHRRRGQTFGQDEASCAVFGMPQAAQRLGALTVLAPPEELATAILRAVALVRS